MRLQGNRTHFSYEVLSLCRHQDGHINDKGLGFARTTIFSKSVPKVPPLKQQFRFLPLSYVYIISEILIKIKLFFIKIFKRFFDHSSLSFGTKVNPSLFVHRKPWVEAPLALPNKPQLHRRRIPRPMVSRVSLLSHITIKRSSAFLIALAARPRFERRLPQRVGGISSPLEYHYPTAPYGSRLRCRSPYGY